jgi:hypothetical protein
LFLVLRGTPATGDVELDPVVRGISCSSVQRTEERWTELSYTRNLVVKDRRAVGDDTVSFARHTALGPVARGSASGSSGARLAGGLLAEAIWTACWSRAPISGTWRLRRIGAGCRSRAAVLAAKGVDG